MRNESVYLTVDLDFWDWDRRKQHDVPKGMMQEALRICNRLSKLKCKVTVYVSHESVLDDLSKNSYTHVVNIDRHDDIVVPTDVKNSADEACWVNKVPNRDKMIYEWRYPDFHNCCQLGLGLCSKPTERLWPLAAHDWSYIKRKEGLDDLPWKNVNGASVVLSPRYSCPTVALKFAKTLRSKRKIVNNNNAVLQAIAEWENLFPW